MFHKKPQLTFLVSVFIFELFSGCATTPTTNQSYEFSDANQAITIHPELPRPDLRLEIKGLGPNNDSPNREFQLNSKYPVTVLVHGCFGSAGKFAALSDILAFHGQQSISFSYDDRANLMQTSRELADAIEELSTHLESPTIVLIGHSLGGLVARKALIKDRPDPIHSNIDISLVTISAPLAGIRAARFSAYPFLRFISLGLNDLFSRVFVGEKWHQITYASDFIQEPGELVDAVKQHLLIATDEEDSCSQYDESGQCLKNDFVFTLAEQNLSAVSSSERTKSVIVKAGHVEIVGESGMVPRKLINVLQEEGFINLTEQSRASEFSNLLASIY